MKERLYNQEGRLTEQGMKLSSEFGNLIYTFIKDNSHIYDIRDLESMMKWCINDDILNEILGF